MLPDFGSDNLNPTEDAWAGLARWQEGGAVWCGVGSALYIRASVFVHNTASGAGGAVYLAGGGLRGGH